MSNENEIKENSQNKTLCQVKIRSTHTWVDLHLNSVKLLLLYLPHLFERNYLLSLISQIGLARLTNIYRIYD